MRVLLVLFVLLVPTGLFAQAPPVQVQLGPSTPTFEIDAHLDIFSAFAGGTWGARFARRQQDWLVTEFSYDQRSQTNQLGEGRLLVASVRLQDPLARWGRRAFMTAGLAVADHYTFRWSPVVSAGVQHEAPGQPLAFRAEFQWLVRGHRNEHYDQSRFLLGLVLGIP